MRFGLLRRLHRALDPAGIRADGALRSGAAAGSRAVAYSTSPAAPWSTSPPASPPSRPRSSASEATTGCRPSSPTTCPSCSWAPGFLWFGWFGFNGGSALAANELAALAFAKHRPGPDGHAGRVGDAGLLPRSGHATAVGAATAIVVGLVAITPAAGFVSPGAALLLGGSLRSRAIS